MTSLFNRNSTKQTTQTTQGGHAVAKADTIIPYKGDDWAQAMSKNFALPMLAMGVMAVVLAFILAIAGGINLGDFFSPSGEAADLGRGETLVQWTGAIMFLGMGFVLSAIAMTLVNVVRTLRDAGRDVQMSLGASALQLKKPWTGTATWVLMMMGVMVEMLAFVLGIVAAVSIGGVDPAAIADPSIASAGDLGDIGLTRAIGTWLPGLRLLGLAVILLSVVSVLTTIQKVIRFQGDRVSEIAKEAQAA